MDLDGSDEAELQARFEVLYMLGRGAYGTVWKANDRTLGQPVAIKVIPLVDTDKEELQAIQREIQFLAGCNHPNIVKYLGSCRHRHELWIIMEYCGGGSVSDLLSATQRPVPEAAVAYVCGEALKGLTYLHSLNKVHRDIKCGNILLTDSGAVKLADFGVAAQLTATMSKRQTFIGTPHWMAPEVIQESRYDGKVDVWALGISAIEMAEMTPPRWAVHPLRVIFMISREPPPKLTTAPDSWSHLFHAFLEACLTKEPKSRPTARYLLQHRFVLQQQQQAGGADASGGPNEARGFTELLPLVDLSMRYLAHAAASAETPQGQGGVLEMAQQSTGHFSWRGVPAHGGTVLAAGHPARAGAPGGAGAAAAEGDAQDEALPMPRMPEPSESPAAVGLAGRGGRARLQGAGPQHPTPAAPQTPGPAAEDSQGATVTSPDGSAYDSTVVARGFGDTVVVHEADTVRVNPPVSRMRTRTRTHEPSRSNESMPSIFDTARPGAKPQDSGAAGGYKAAIRAAAAEAQRERERMPPSPQLSPGRASHAVPPVAATAPVPHAPVKDERARTIERLHAVYESGLVVTTPFLPALHAQPLALLAPLSSAHCDDTDIIQGMDGSMYRALATLVSQSAAMTGHPDTAAATQPEGGPPALPSYLLERVWHQPELQNCLRTLAYNLAAMSALPLGAAAAAELQQSIDDMSQALSAMLLSGVGLS